LKVFTLESLSLGGKHNVFGQSERSGEAELQYSLCLCSSAFNH